MLCADVTELEASLGALRRHPRAAVCLDTCHLFAALEALRDGED